MLLIWSSFFYVWLRHWLLLLTVLCYNILVFVWIGRGYRISFLKCTQNLKEIKCRLTCIIKPICLNHRCRFNRWRRFNPIFKIDYRFALSFVASNGYFELFVLYWFKNRWNFHLLIVLTKSILMLFFQRFFLLQNIGYFGIVVWIYYFVLCLTLCLLSRVPTLITLNIIFHNW